MGTTVHVLDYLKRPVQPAAVTVLFGDEPFLKNLAIHQLLTEALPEDAEAGASRMEGTAATWRDVSDELHTVSLFNQGGRRVVILEEADPFVTEYRDRLEAYVERPARTALLILMVSKWAANTRLYRIVGKMGLQVECRAPTAARGRSKSLDTGRVIEWIAQWGRQRQNITLDKPAARTLFDLVGPEFGLLDQELAKLALHVQAGASVDAETVRTVSGGWKTQTAWELIEAGVSGRADEAMRQLDRLLLSGEHPNALFGPIAWSLRRYAMATRRFERAERTGQRIALSDALKQAGFNAWAGNELKTAERLLKRLGRERAAQLFQELLELDLALKGSHSSPPLARLALERLFLSFHPEAG